MRRLRVVVVTGGLLLAACGPALAASPERAPRPPGRAGAPVAETASVAARVPRGVKRIVVSLAFPFTSGPGAHAPVRRTLTRPATVARVVAATDALRRVRIVHPCPMLRVRGPELALVYRGARGAPLATLMVQVTTGRDGRSGASPCFSIRFSSAGREQLLLSNGFVRMAGRLLGTPIS
ncbi:MAG TPA: hypothetical protein VFN36_05530 [Solirubrobacteraceae bacterium]|nr:hypothetical protein [Solirubrobacteraceae bacterium]